MNTSLYVLRLTHKTRGESYYLGDQSILTDDESLSVRTIELGDFVTGWFSVVTVFSKSRAQEIKDKIISLVTKHQPENIDALEVNIEKKGFTSEQVGYVMNKPHLFLNENKNDSDTNN